MTTLTTTGTAAPLLALGSSTFPTSDNQLSALIPSITSDIVIIGQALTALQFTGMSSSYGSVSATLGGTEPGGITFKGSGLNGNTRKISSIEFDPTATDAWNWKVKGVGSWNSDGVHMSRITSAEIANEAGTTSYLLKGNMRIAADRSIAGTLSSVKVTSGDYNLEMIGRFNADDIADGTIRKLTLSDTDGNSVTLNGSLSSEWLALLNDAEVTIGDLFSRANLFSGNDVFKASVNSREWFGFDGNDIMTGGGQNDTMDGGSGNDRISGLDGSDQLYGDDGNDKLYGGAGNDTLMGSSGNDHLFGEGGNDQLDGGSGNDHFVDLVGDNLISDSGGNNQVQTGAGNDAIYTSSGNDVIRAGDGNNEISDTGGNNTIITGSGNDIVTVGSGHDVIRTGAGDDWIITGGGRDTVNAGAGNDIVEASLVMDSAIVGGAGNDTLSLASVATANTAMGISGFETLLLTGADLVQDMSVFKKNPGFTTISNAGVTSTFSKVGASVINYTNTESGAAVTISRATDTAADALTITAKSGTSISSVTANDEETIAVKSSSSGDVTISALNASDLQNLTITGAGKVNITSLSAISASTASSLKIDGSSNTAGISVSADSSTKNAEVIGSATASSTIIGGDGSDTVTGGTDADVIGGGAGADILTGGAGADIFQFDSSVSSYTGGAPGSANDFDTISDYQKGVDIIDDVNRVFSLSTDATDVATAGVAGISHTTGIATFDDADVTLVQRVTAVNASLAAGTEASGQIAIFEYGSDTYVYIYDDTDDTINASDGLIKLTGVTGINAADLTTSMGNLVLSTIV